MRLTRLTIGTRDLDAAHRVYHDDLGLPTTREERGVTVRIGASTLTLVHEPGLVGDHHLAWTVPTGSFDEAFAWASDRAPLLRADDGAAVLEAAPAWDARSVYFSGPDGQVLELIERRALPGAPAASFDASDLVSISEVGIAVTDVLHAVERLAALGLEPYGGAPSPGFAAVGDVHGMLILVPAGRAWAPTHDRGAADGRVDVDADVPGAIALSPRATVRGA